MSTVLATRGTVHALIVLCQAPQGVLMESTSVLIQIAIGLATLIGMLATGAATVWVFFRGRVRRWWAPYKSGLEGLGELPAIRVEVAESRAEMRALSKDLGLLTLAVRIKGDNNLETGEFECGIDGACTYASRTLSRWLSVGKNDLLRWGWINYICPADRLRVRKEWDLCRLEHRIFSMRYDMIDEGGENFPVETIIQPVPDAAPAKQWMGAIRKIVV